MKQILILRICLVTYFLLLAAYSFFSYSLVHPNLVLTAWPPYWVFQNWVWQTFFNNRLLLTQTYTVLICALFVNFLAIVSLLKKTIFTKKHILIYLLLISPLFLSFNALSSDVFNYIFNARMVLVYHTNPHLVSALHFPNDPMLHFMMNIEGLAPYGYGWTAISLLPSLLGLQKFVLTWLLFRIYSLISLFLLGASYYYFAGQKKLANLALVFLNPLILIEFVSNTHNDIWMMWPAVLSLSLLFFGQKKKLWQGVLLSGALLAFSISIKLVTVVLLPIWCGLFIWLYLSTQMKKNLERVVSFWPILAALFLFVPLLTDRSRQFYPWYLSWVLVWLPFIKSSFWRRSVIFLSFSAMLRYLPWLLANLYTDQIEMQQKMMIWIPFLLFVLGELVWFVLIKFKSLYANQSSSVKIKV